MMASEAITQSESRDLPSTLDNLSGAIPTLPTLIVTSPEGYVHEILPPVRRTAVRLSPAAIRRLQAARYAESPLATASSLLAEQEEPVAEVQKLLLYYEFTIHSGFPSRLYQSVNKLSYQTGARSSDVRRSCGAGHRLPGLVNRSDGRIRADQSARRPLR